MEATVSIVIVSWFMDDVWIKEGLTLNKKKRLALLILGIVVVIFGVIVVQAFILKPASTVKLTKIPAG